MFDSRDQKSANIGHFWMHLLATNDEYCSFLGNFLDIINIQKITKECRFKQEYYRK